MLELTTVKSLRETVRQWRADGELVALVPTMGALHRGHLSLLEMARQHAKHVVVSIFVNPTQFGPGEDFERYPRPREHDVMMLRMEGADAVWLPTVEEMYPEGFATTVRVEGIRDVLEGVHRPGHFDGVATVVTKLLLQVMPDLAFFGEKDYQQLVLIKRLVKDLNIDVRAIGAPTVRELSGLALSSRNQYLSEKEHEVAPKLYAVLSKLGAELKNTQTVIPATLLEHAKSELLAAGFSKVDYLALCDGESLQEISEYRPHARLLAAAWLGKTRLIDNIRVG